MTVDDWVLEAVRALSRGRGATLREVQRFIDERHFEELAVDTLQSSLDKLVAKGRLEESDEHWSLVKGTSREDAAKKLFGDG